MQSLPNSHQALLKNQHLLSGRLALLGVASAHLLPELPVTGLAMSEHAGVFQALGRKGDWQACFGYDDPELTEGEYDSNVVFLPKARAELEMRLALAQSLAAENAQLILIGEKKEGIAGAIKQLKAVAPQAYRADSARHCQVWCAPAIEPARGFRVQDWLSWNTAECAGVSVQVAGLPGIFSQDSLDDGTRMLLETLQEQPVRADRVLEVLGFYESPYPKILDAFDSSDSPSPAEVRLMVFSRGSMDDVLDMLLAAPPSAEEFTALRHRRDTSISFFRDLGSRLAARASNSEVVAGFLKMAREYFEPGDELFSHVTTEQAADILSLEDLLTCKGRDEVKQLLTSHEVDLSQFLRFWTRRRSAPLEDLLAVLEA